jgi:pimeloyl-ACP methyl ester carboxylesterase
LGAPEVDVVGFSLGAYRALRLALSGRIRVGVIVSLGGFASLTEPHRSALRAFAATVEKMPDFRDRSLRRQTAPMLLAPSFLVAHPQDAEGIEAWLDDTTPAVLGAELRASAEAENLEGVLSSVQIPVIARLGEMDAAAPVAYSNGCAAAAGKARDRSWMRACASGGGPGGDDAVGVQRARRDWELMQWPLRFGRRHRSTD